MKHPITFTFLGFHFNSLVDSGEFIELTEMREKLSQGNLFKWLEEKYGHRVDVSLFTNEEIKKIESFFRSLSENVDEGKKMGIERNGLCLLVAYCFDGAQKEEEDIR